MRLSFNGNDHFTIDGSIKGLIKHSKVMGGREFWTISITAETMNDFMEKVLSGKKDILAWEEFIEEVIKDIKDVNVIYPYIFTKTREDAIRVLKLLVNGRDILADDLFE